jgi:tetratricopeptide (TPR) repeat protein
LRRAPRGKVTTGGMMRVRAEGLVLRLLELRPGMAEGHRQLGLLKKQRGLLREAERAFQKSLSLRPGFAAASFSLANLYRDQGRFSEAAALYERMIAEFPEHIGAHRNLGDLRLRQGDFSRAAEVFVRARRRFPGESLLLYGLGRAQEELGMVREAIGNYRRFLQEAGPGMGGGEAIRQRINTLEEKLKEER